MPRPAPLSIHTSCPWRTSSLALSGVSPTRYSLFLISRGQPISIAGFLGRRSLGLEQRKVDRLADRSQPGVAAVEKIAHVIAVAHLRRIGRIGERGIEAHDGVERAAVDDPVVDLLARRLAFFRPVARPLVRADRAADHLDPLLVGAGDDLPEAGDHLLDADLRLVERQPTGTAA